MGEDRERFEVTVKPPVEHPDFKVTWSKSGARYTMKWKSEAVTMGGFGPTNKTYSSFSLTLNVTHDPVNVEVPLRGELGGHRLPRTDLGLHVYIDRKWPLKNCGPEHEVHRVASQR